MAILINDNYSLAAQKPFDARYLNISTPWTSIAAVNAGIPTYRYHGLTVNINGDEYWYKNGILDTDLILKSTGSSGGTTTTIIGSTGITAILSGTTYTISIKGISLAGNSLLWSGNSFNVNINSGTLSTALGSKLDTTDFDTFTGTTLPNTYYDKIEIDTIVSGITSNSVSVTMLTTPVYSATSTDDYIGASGGTIIYMPLTPKLGQRIIVVDVIGNASTDDIIIDGNGKLVNGTTYATINTDFGSITFIYTGSFWSVTAFII